MSNLTFPTIKATRLESRTKFFETTVQRADSGAEFRIRRREPGYRYTLTVACKMASGEHTTLAGFFEYHSAMQESFLFVDPVDSITRRVRFDTDELEESYEPGLMTYTVELTTVVST